MRRGCTTLRFPSMRPRRPRCWRRTRRPPRPWRPRRTRRPRCQCDAAGAGPLRRDVADMGHPIPVHSNRGRGSLSGNTRLRPHRDRGHDPAADRSPADRFPVCAGAVALGRRLRGYRNGSAVGAPRLGRAAHLEFASGSSGGGSAAGRHCDRRRHWRSGPDRRYRRLRVAGRTRRSRGDRRGKPRLIEYDGVRGGRSCRPRLCRRSGDPGTPARRPLERGRNGVFAFVLCSLLCPDRRPATTRDRAQPRRARRHRRPRSGLHRGGVPAVLGTDRRDRPGSIDRDHLLQPGGGCPVGRRRPE